MGLRLGIDIGGTFTDAVLFDPNRGEIRTAKTLSTPDDLVHGVERVLKVVVDDIANVSTLVHGSTVVINSLIERKGARAALLTTKGFRDVYEIGRINRPDSFNLRFTKHVPLVPRQLIYELDERILADGSVEHKLDEMAVRDVARALLELGVESVAVVLLHSYRNSEHEERVGELFAEEAPKMFVSLSHELTREYREYERTSTTAANAYVGPVVSGYLDRLEQRLDNLSFSGIVGIMQSNGGLTDLATARRQCVQMMESGPAGGVVGTAALCDLIGVPSAIAFDMGGTTAKASLVRDGEISEAAEYFIGGYAAGLPIRVPVLDIAEVGTGGGSVAWLDTAGGVHVGPRSAGADPGPCCYGKGGLEPTVTDAAVALGYLAQNGSFSGGLHVDFSAAERAIGTLGDRLGLSAERMSHGILEIATSSMADAVREVTSERGLDPRDFVLVAYGGSGPLYVSLVARELGIREVVIPPQAAVFSALGMLLADAKRNYVITKIEALDILDMTGLEERYRVVEEEADKSLTSGGVPVGSVVVARSADMRYVGQEHTVTVAIPSRLSEDGREVMKRRFDAAHEQLYNHSAPKERAELVSIRVSARGMLAKPNIAGPPPGDRNPPEHAMASERRVGFDADRRSEPCPVYWRASLLAGNVLDGPAIIEEEGTTTVLRPSDRLAVDDRGCLRLRIGE